MKQPKSSPRAPGPDATSHASTPLNDWVGVYQTGDQTPSVEELFVEVSRRVPVVSPGRLAPASLMPTRAEIICDNGGLAFDELLHDIKTWLSARHDAVFGIGMTRDQLLSTCRADAKDGAPPRLSSEQNRRRQSAKCPFKSTRRREPR